MTSSTTVADSTVLVTGANRGLGRALVEEVLRRGAKRVYAGSRQPQTHASPRVRSLALDITDPAQVRAAGEQIDELDLLINNAGVSLPDDLGGREALEHHLAVNLYGTWDVTRAFLPALRRSQGAIVNVVSLAAFAAVPVLPAYSISKAALFALTQSQRMLLAGDGVAVHAVMAGPIDTDMVRGLEIPKTAPEVVARGVLDGVARGEEEIFPDAMSVTLAPGWYAGDAKALERQNAALVRPERIAA
ncbi:MAG TPA: SDR family NAD(P)-dependent oxidoreductase [Solirubrobacteraceae bacterium]|nr:SDR family NAD(P)-dependent oxidoreductase [Solirubrobacteraceae bacterium]